MFVHAEDGKVTFLPEIEECVQDMKDRVALLKAAAAMRAAGATPKVCGLCVCHAGMCVVGQVWLDKCVCGGGNGWWGAGAVESNMCRCRLPDLKNGDTVVPGPESALGWYALAFVSVASPFSLSLSLSRSLSVLITCLDVRHHSLCRVVSFVVQQARLRDLRSPLR